MSDAEKAAEAYLKDEIMVFGAERVHPVAMRIKFAFLAGYSAAQTWRPIATAPRDGTEIIGGTKGEGDVEFYRFLDGAWVTRGDYYPPINKLTHFIHNPLPPSE